MTKPDRGVFAFLLGVLVAAGLLVGVVSLVSTDSSKGVSSLEDFSRGSVLVEGKSCELTLPNGTKVKGSVYRQIDGTELCTTFPPLISGANEGHANDGKHGKRDKSGKGDKSGNSAKHAPTGDQSTAQPLPVLNPDRTAAIQFERVCESEWASLLDEISEA